MIIPPDRNKNVGKFEWYHVYAKLENISELPPIMLEVKK